MAGGSVFAPVPGGRVDDNDLQKSGKRLLAKLHLRFHPCPFTHNWKASNILETNGPLPVTIGSTDP